MYLSGLEGGPHTNPDPLALSPTILLLIHTNATLCATGFPLSLSQDELSVDLWGTQSIPRGGVSVRSRAREK